MNMKKLKRLDNECCGSMRGFAHKERIKTQLAALPSMDLEGLIRSNVKAINKLPPIRFEEILPVGDDDNSRVDQKIGDDFDRSDTPITEDELESLLKTVKSETSPAANQLEFVTDLPLRNLYTDVVFQLGIAEGMRHSLRRVESRLRDMMSLRKKEHKDGDK
jgi:hypothetical protein